MSEVVIHGDELTPYLRTSKDGAAHVVYMPLSRAAMHVRDSPYTWGDPKGSSNTSMCMAGRWRPYQMNAHGCVPALVCSRMRSEVAGVKHREVDYDNPTWLTALQFCEESEISEQQALKTTLVRILQVFLCAWGYCRIFCFIGSLQEERPVTTRFRDVQLLPASYLFVW